MRISDWSSDVCSSDLPVTPYPYRPNAKRWQKGYIETRFRYTNNPWTYVAFWMLSYELANRWPESQCPTLRAEWDKIGRASCRERVCQYVSISVVAVSLKKKQT